MLDRMICPTCKCKLEGIKKGAIGKVTFCETCYTRHSKIRLDRMGRDLYGKAFLVKRHKEMQEARIELAKLREDVVKERERIRNDVLVDILEKIKRLSFWQRLKVLFNPFEYTNTLIL